MTLDPVCGMRCDEKTAAGIVELQGKSYCFCSTECKNEFEKHPMRYVGTHTT